MGVRTLTSYGALLIACSLAPCVGGCASQPQETASAQWYFDGAHYVEETEGGPVSSSAVSSDDSAPFAGQSPVKENWSERTYVYRGGRDPKTGLAYKQM